jgi:hypothetical protein
MNIHNTIQVHEHPQYNTVHEHYKTQQKTENTENTKEIKRDEYTARK